MKSLVLGGISLLVVLASWFVCGQVDTEPNYLLEMRGTVETWGHEVIQRNHSGTERKPRSWVDPAVRLPAGRVLKFMAFIHRIPTSAHVIRFQIWQPKGGVNYQLVFEIKGTVPNSVGVWEVEVDDEVYIPDSCRLGWTNDVGGSPISFDFVEKYKLYFRGIEKQDYPEQGLIYDFASLAYPAVASVAVDIDTRKC